MATLRAPAPAAFEGMLAEAALVDTADAAAPAGDVLSLRYGTEVALRSSSGLCLSVAPVGGSGAQEVDFRAGVRGLGLGRREERFVACNAMLRDDRGPVK